MFSMRSCRGNRVLDEDGGLTVGSGVGGDYIKCLKKGWDRKKVGETKKFKEEGMSGNGVGALKRGAVIPLRAKVNQVDL